jgi:hypothetical protein
VQENKIDNYIKEYFILQKGVKIEFCKGDSHPIHSTSKSFSYNNFLLLASVGWVQVNFQNSISGFVHNYYDNQQRSINYILINM